MQRSSSATSRKQGLKFINRHKMQPELYSAAVKGGISGEAQVMVTFNDLATVSVLYEMVSGILCVCKHSFSLVYEKMLIPCHSSTSEGYVKIPQAMHFFGFNKCPTVDFVFKMPPECNICTMQCRQSGEEYWKFGTVHQRLSDQKPEVHKNMPGVLCYCCLGDKLAWDTFLGVYSEADELSEGADEADECLQPITRHVRIDGPPANLRTRTQKPLRPDR